MAKICLKFTCFGNLAIPNFTAKKLKPNTPTVLPTTKPRVMPKVNGDSKLDKFTSLSVTPALEKANSGRIK